MIVTVPAPTRSPFAIPRDFLGNHFVYITVSPRARGLSVGVNFNPDQHCNFDCAYCEVDRSLPPRVASLDIEVMVTELEATLALIQADGLRQRAPYRTVPPHLLTLRHVALSGDGEPTLCPNFLEAVHAVLHLRARSGHPFFKIVLLTNATGLDRPEVQAGLQLFTRQDELWVKLDAGTAEHLHHTNRTGIPLEKILENILRAGRQRPVVIQSLFAKIEGHEPSSAEIDQYAGRLAELRNQGAQISLVQIYSATRPVFHRDCHHLSLRRLSEIAQAVRAKTGLKVEVY